MCLTTPLRLDRSNWDIRLKPLRLDRSNWDIRLKPLRLDRSNWDIRIADGHALPPPKHKPNESEYRLMMKSAAAMHTDIDPKTRYKVRTI
jgi:hypothetical protein